MRCTCVLVMEKQQSNLILFTALAMTPMLCLTLLFSQISPLAEGIISGLVAVPRVLGFSCGLLAAAFAFGCWWWGWRNWPKGQQDFALFAGLAMAIVTLVLLFPTFPVMVPALLMFLSPIILYVVASRELVSLPDPWWTASLGSLYGAGILFSVWCLWILLRMLVHHVEWWSDWTVPFRHLVEDDVITWKQAFVAWAIPAAVSLELLMFGLLAATRRGTTDMDDDARLVAEVKTLGVVIGTAVIVLWITASLNATGDPEYGQKRENMRDELMGLAFWMSVCIAAWTLYHLGPSKVFEAAEKSKVAQQIREAVESDWFKAFLLAAFGPLLPAFAVLHTLRGQAASSSLGRGVVTLWPDNINWAWTSIIVKAQLLGLGYISFAYVGLKATTVLLSLTNEFLASWSLAAVCWGIFVIGTFLFLLPPTPGVPVYMVAGIVISASAEHAGLGFNTGIALATFVAFAMKMCFAGVAQKCIGEPLANSVYVRSMCRVHTVEMRAIQKILAADGITVPKVLMCIGGPDWPVAVLCGILRLSVCQILLATSPVLLQSVFPCVLAGALQTHAKDDKTKALAETSLAIAGLFQMVAGLGATYFTQEYIEKYFDELSVERPEDEDIRRLDAEAQEQEAKVEAATRWDGLPEHMRAILIGGLCCIWVSLLLLEFPTRKVFHTEGCFKKFNFMSTVAKDLNGNALSIVNPLGWVALSFSCLSGVAVMVFQQWGSRREVEEDQVGLAHQTLS